MSALMAGNKPVYSAYEWGMLDNPQGGAFRFPDWVSCAAIITVGGSGGGGGGSGNYADYVGQPGTGGEAKFNWVMLTGGAPRNLSYTIGAAGAGGAAGTSANGWKAGRGGAGGVTTVTGCVEVSALGGAGGAPVFAHVPGVKPPELAAEQRPELRSWSIPALWQKRMPGVGDKFSTYGGPGAWPGKAGNPGADGFIYLYMWGYQV